MTRFSQTHTHYRPLLLSLALLMLIAAFHTAQAAPTAKHELFFTSPRKSSLSHIVFLSVHAPAGTKDVRFFLNDVQLSELTDQYARDTKSAPIWKTAFDASWFQPGDYLLKAVAQTATGEQIATKAVTLMRPSQPASIESLDGGWHFASADELPEGALAGENPPAAATEVNDAEWAKIVVPDSLGAVDRKWMRPEGLLGVYRRTFTLNHLERSRQYYLLSSSCYWLCRYFVNGTAIGSSHGGYLPRRFNMTAALHKGKNTIAVVIDDRASTMGVFNRLRYYYWNYGGLLEGIRIESTPPVALTEFRAQGTAAGQLTLYPFGVNTTGQAQRITAQVSVLNAQGNRIFGPRKISTLLPAEGGAATTVSLTIPHPQLWSLEHPNLYTVDVTVTSPHHEAALTEQTGFRDITIRGAQLYLNGKPVDDLQGFDRHADYPGLGRTQPPGLVDQEMHLLHQKGFRLFRPAHYPTTPAELHAADKYGMLVLEEINVTGLSGKELASPAVIAFAHQQLKREIDRDRSHPSIFAWSVGNENRTDQPGSPTYIQNVIQFGKALDPTRPFTEVSAQLTHDICYPYEDFVAMNIYGGWYTPKISDVIDAVNQVQAYAGNKPVVITEYGAGAVYGRPGYGPGTEYYQARVIDGYNQDLYHRPNFIGKMYWTSTEFIVGPKWNGGTPDPIPPYHVKGLLTYYRQPKLGWRVIFSPIRIEPVPAIPLASLHAGEVTRQIVIHDLKDHRVAATLLVTPPAGFTVDPQKQSFVVSPAHDAVLTLTLKATGEASNPAEPGMIRAVVNQETEALPRLLQIEPEKKATNSTTEKP